MLGVIKVIVKDFIHLIKIIKIVYLWHKIIEVYLISFRNVLLEKIRLCIVAKFFWISLCIQKIDLSFQLQQRLLFQYKLKNIMSKIVCTVKYWWQKQKSQENHQIQKLLLRLPILIKNKKKVLLMFQEI